MDVFPVDAKWRTWVFVRLGTDNGLTGWGEATLVFRDATILGALEELREYVIGMDPLRPDHFWSTRFYRTIFHGPSFYSALAAVDHAVWDLIGKSLEVPVYKLIGGAVRSSIRLYANTWFGGARTPDEYAERASAAVGLGFDALKFDPLPGSLLTANQAELQSATEKVAAVRSAVGPDVDLLIECHGRLTPESAVRLIDGLAPYDPYWVEEPVPAHNPRAMLHVRERSPDVSLAAGERLFTRWGARELLSLGAIDIIQPDMTQVGGISEAKRVAALAALNDVLVAPHCPRGPVATATGVHFAASTPNFLILEYALDVGGVPWRQELLEVPEVVEEGRMALPTSHGLGSDLIEKELVKHRSDRIVTEIPSYFDPDFNIK